MQQFLIKIVNAALVIVVLIGVPSIAAASFGHWQLSSTPVTQKAML
ncbi:MAG: hypothetical protein KGJ88_10950 [Verrucomicrobiota bacterium]|nr:hypothetical protein [Verrucomicrobiota bacterium]